MTERLMKFEIIMNPKNIQTIAAFVNLKCRCMSFQKEGYFLRHIGCESQEVFLKEVERMDAVLRVDENKKVQAGYLRVFGFSKAMTKNDLERFTAMYDRWQCLDFENRLNFDFPFVFQNALWDRACKEAFEKVISLFATMSGKNTPTMVRNFAVKLLYWLKQYLPKLFLDTSSLRHFPKLVYCGSIKEQEYLFLYFLTQIGCDVLYMNTLEDIVFSSSSLLMHSQETRHKCLLEFKIPEMASRSFVPPPKIYTTLSPVQQSPVQSVTAAANFTQTEADKDYESLASLATAVVMVSAYNEEKECIKTGSAVLINKKGYILTNFHVVQGGHYFGVRMEEVDEIFYTTELVKYHNLNDLALLKIEFEHEPIPIYQSTKALARGQKVIAIGSPLGLFNSVSDGMISGFRTVRDVPMIQFTAPISNGSSGGALLDLHGRLIGIITAGFDNGQNLNLAVDYETVLLFVRGFI